MRFLLLIAHGSRRVESNDSVVQTAEALGIDRNVDFDAVRWAFLEMAQPSIPEAIDQCVCEGALEIVVLPYFLSPGNHVTRDIPEVLSTKRSQYPSLTITCLDYFGSSPAISDWLAQHINR